MYIDLSSDTVTKPTPEMRKAMYDAEVGNEQSGTDPVVNQLLAEVADLLGKESALFLPSGTMCNLVAMRVLCPGGGGMLVDTSAHVLHAEGDGYSQVGMVAHIIPGHRGIYSLDQLALARIAGGSQYQQASRLIWVEQSANLGGGTCWSIREIQDIYEYAQMYRIKSHLVGARLMNAVIATGVSAQKFAANFDSVWLGLTKGLGAPFGAVLAGSFEYIQEAKYARQQFGGGMRQAGIMAAAGLYALQHHVQRLKDDHEHARVLADGLAELGLNVSPVQTNIVRFDVSPTGCSALSICAAMEEQGVHLFSNMSSLGPYGIRAVTHLDVGSEQVTATLQAMERVVLAAAKKRDSSRGALAWGTPGWNAD